MVNSKGSRETLGMEGGAVVCIMHYGNLPRFLDWFSLSFSFPPLGSFVHSFIHSFFPFRVLALRRGVLVSIILVPVV